MESELFIGPSGYYFRVYLVCHWGIKLLSDPESSKLGLPFCSKSGKVKFSRKTTDFTNEKPPATSSLESLHSD